MNTFNKDTTKTCKTRRLNILLPFTNMMSLCIFILCNSYLANASSDPYFYTIYVSKTNSQGQLTQSAVFSYSPNDDGSRYFYEGCSGSTDLDLTILTNTLNVAYDRFNLSNVDPTKCDIESEAYLSEAHFNLLTMAGFSPITDFFNNNSYVVSVFAEGMISDCYSITHSILISNDGLIKLIAGLGPGSFVANNIKIRVGFERLDGKLCCSDIKCSDSASIVATNLDNNAFFSLALLPCTFELADNLFSVEIFDIIQEDNDQGVCSGWQIKQIFYFNDLIKQANRQIFTNLNNGFCNYGNFHCEFHKKADSAIGCTQCLYCSPRVWLFVFLVFLTLFYFALSWSARTHTHRSATRSEKGHPHDSTGCSLISPTNTPGTEEH